MNISRQIKGLRRKKELHQGRGYWEEREYEEKKLKTLSRNEQSDGGKSKKETRGGRSPVCPGETPTATS